LVPTDHQKNDVPSAVHVARLRNVLDERLEERVLKTEQQTSVHNRE